MNTITGLVAAATVIGTVGRVWSKSTGATDRIGERNKFLDFITNDDNTKISEKAKGCYERFTTQEYKSQGWFFGLFGQTRDIRKSNTYSYLINTDNSNKIGQLSPDSKKVLLNQSEKAMQYSRQMEHIFCTIAQQSATPDKPTAKQQCEGLLYLYAQRDKLIVSAQNLKRSSNIGLQAQIAEDIEVIQSRITTAESSLKKELKLCFDSEKNIGFNEFFKQFQLTEPDSDKAPLNSKYQVEDFIRLYAFKLRITNDKNFREQAIKDFRQYIFSSSLGNTYAGEMIGQLYGKVIADLLNESSIGDVDSHSNISQRFMQTVFNLLNDGTSKSLEMLCIGDKKDGNIKAAQNFEVRSGFEDSYYLKTDGVTIVNNIFGYYKGLSEISKKDDPSKKLLHFDDNRKKMLLWNLVGGKHPYKGNKKGIFYRIDQQLKNFSPKSDSEMHGKIEGFATKFDRESFVDKLPPNPYAIIDPQNKDLRNKNKKLKLEYRYTTQSSYHNHLNILHKIAIRCRLNDLEFPEQQNSDKKSQLKLLKANYNKLLSDNQSHKKLYKKYLKNVLGTKLYNLFIEIDNSHMVTAIDNVLFCNNSFKGSYSLKKPVDNNEDKLGTVVTQNDNNYKLDGSLLDGEKKSYTLKSLIAGGVYKIEYDENNVTTEAFFYKSPNTGKLKKLTIIDQTMSIDTVTQKLNQGEDLRTLFDEFKTNTLAGDFMDLSADRKMALKNQKFKIIVEEYDKYNVDTHLQTYTNHAEDLRNKLKASSTYLGMKDILEKLNNLKEIIQFYKNVKNNTLASKEIALSAGTDELYLLAKHAILDTKEFISKLYARYKSLHEKYNDTERLSTQDNNQFEVVEGEILEYSFLTTLFDFIDTYDGSNHFFICKLSSDKIKTSIPTRNGIYKTLDGKYFQIINGKIREEFQLKDSTTSDQENNQLLQNLENNQLLHPDMINKLFNGYIQNDNSTHPQLDIDSILNGGINHCMKRLQSSQYIETATNTISTLNNTSVLIQLTKQKDIFIQFADIFVTTTDNVVGDDTLEEFKDNISLIIQDLEQRNNQLNNQEYDKDKAQVFHQDCKNIHNFLVELFTTKYCSGFEYKSTQGETIVIKLNNTIAKSCQDAYQELQETNSSDNNWGTVSPIHKAIWNNLINDSDDSILAKMSLYLEQLFSDGFDYQPNNNSTKFQALLTSYEATVENSLLTLNVMGHVHQELLGHYSQLIDGVKQLSHINTTVSLKSKLLSVLISNNYNGFSLTDQEKQLYLKTLYKSNLYTYPRTDKDNPCPHLTENADHTQFDAHAPKKFENPHLVLQQILGHLNDTDNDNPVNNAPLFNYALNTANMSEDLRKTSDKLAKTLHTEKENLKSFQEKLVAIDTKVTSELISVSEDTIKDCDELMNYFEVEKKHSSNHSFEESANKIKVRQINTHKLIDNYKKLVDEEYESIRKQSDRNGLQKITTEVEKARMVFETNYQELSKSGLCGEIALFDSLDTTIVDISGELQQEITEKIKDYLDTKTLSAIAQPLDFKSLQIIYDSCSNNKSKEQRTSIKKYLNNFQYTKIEQQFAKFYISYNNNLSNLIDSLKIFNRLINNVDSSIPITKQTEINTKNLTKLIDRSNKYLAKVTKHITEITSLVSKHPDYAWLLGSHQTDLEQHKDKHFKWFANNYPKLDLINSNITGKVKDKLQFEVIIDYLKVYKHLDKYGEGLEDDIKLIEKFYDAPEEITQQQLTSIDDKLNKIFTFLENDKNQYGIITTLIQNIRNTCSDWLGWLLGKKPPIDKEVIRKDLQKLYDVVYWQVIQKSNDTIIEIELTTNKLDNTVNTFINIVGTEPFSYLGKIFEEAKNIRDISKIFSDHAQAFGDLQNKPNYSSMLKLIFTNIKNRESQNNEFKNMEFKQFKDSIDKALSSLVGNFQ